MEITRTHPVTGEINTRDIPVTAQQLNLWKHGGKMIQVAMPNISSDDREFILTGLLPDDFKDFEEL